MSHTDSDSDVSSAHALGSARSNLEVQSKRSWRRRSRHQLQHFWAAPRLRRRPATNGHGHGQELHEHWVELINDLVMVAFLSNLAHAMLKGGPWIFSNFWVKLQVFLLMMYWVHFTSIMVNLWVVRDLVTLALLCSMTIGTIILSIGLHTPEHLPCRVDWPTSLHDCDLQLKAAIVVSSSAQLCLLGLQSFFEPRARSWSKAPIVASIVVLLLGVTADPHHSTAIEVLRFTIISVVNFAGAWYSFAATEMANFLDMHHMQSRLDMMVLVALGEWLLQAVLSDLEVGVNGVQQVLVHTGMVFAIAINYFNTQQQEKTDDASGLRHLLLKFLEVATHYFLSFAVFFVAGIIALDAFLDKDTTQSDHGAEVSNSTTTAAPHELVAGAKVLIAVGRRLGGGGGGSEGGGCSSKVEWDRRYAGLMRGWGLFVSRVLELLLRHLRKSQALGQSLMPGKKFWLRAASCGCHVLVAYGEDLFHHPLPAGTVANVHLALLMFDSVLELSVHRMDVETARQRNLMMKREGQQEGVELPACQTQVSMSDVSFAESSFTA